jgi:hypothetical protein
MNVTNKSTGLLCFNAVHFVDSPKFRRNISPPSSGSKNNVSKSSADGRDKLLISCLAYPYLPVICFMVVSCLVYSSALILRRHIPPKRWVIFNGLHGVIRT